MRRYEGEEILALHNLSAATQSVALPLQEWAGSVPVDVLTSRIYPAVSMDSYELKLSPYQYLWLLLGGPLE
jgi:maltose alpha-D-glucosyltransferase/alpha-amylase